MTFATDTPNFERLQPPDSHPVVDRARLWETLTSERVPMWLSCEKPKPEIIEWLQQADSRVHYFPVPDKAEAERATFGMAYSEAIAVYIGRQVVNDFPDTRVAVRATSVALTERFPFWGGRDGMIDMQTVLDMLQSGSEFGTDSVRVREIEPDGSLDMETRHWLGISYEGIMNELGGEQRDQVFPALLVYTPDAFEGGDFQQGVNKLAGPPAGRLAAIYITDKLFIESGW